MLKNAKDESLMESSGNNSVIMSMSIDYQF